MASLTERAIDILDARPVGTYFMWGRELLKKLPNGDWRATRGTLQGVYASIDVVYALRPETIIAENRDFKLPTVVSNKITPTMRNKINARLAGPADGLDGNKPWPKAEHGYAHALDVLSDYGIELDGVVNSMDFKPLSGRVRANLAFTNKEDSFSPTSIQNTMLIVTFAPRGHEGADRTQTRFEVIAYLS